MMFLNGSSQRPKKALDRLMFTIIAVMIMGLVVAACGGPSAPADGPVESSSPTPALTEMQEPIVEVTKDVYPLTIVDGMDREVVLVSPAQRIVSSMVNSTPRPF